MTNRLLPLVAAVALVASPAAGLEFQAVGGAVGATTVAGRVGTTYLLRLQADLGPVWRDIHLVPDISRWSWSQERDDDEIVRTSLFVGANMRYFIPLSALKNVKPYVGGGLGLHGITRKTIQGAWTSSTRDTDIGLNLSAGATYLATPRLRLDGEARGTLVSGYSHLSLTAGASFLIYR